MLLLCLCVSACPAALSEVTNNADPVFCEFFTDYAAGEKAKLLELFDEYYKDLINSPFLIEETKKTLLLETDFSNPVTCVIIVPKEGFSLEEWLAEANLPAGTAVYGTIGRLFETNRFSCLDDFENFALAGAIDNAFTLPENVSYRPQFAYAIFLFSESAPQIATAIYQTEENVYLSKTSFIYNTKVVPKGYPIYMALVEMVCGALDVESTVIRLRNN